MCANVTSLPFLLLFEGTFTSFRDGTFFVQGKDSNSVKFIAREAYEGKQTANCPTTAKLKGKFTKNDNSYPVVLVALSQMVKVRGACDKPFWIYKRLNDCAAPRWTVMTF